MALEADLPTGGLRLLDVDNRLALPIRTNSCFNIPARDILLGWALPQQDTPAGGSVSAHNRCV